RHRALGRGPAPGRAYGERDRRHRGRRARGADRAARAHQYRPAQEGRDRRRHRCPEGPHPLTPASLCTDTDVGRKELPAPPRGPCHDIFAAVGLPMDLPMTRILRFAAAALVAALSLVQNAGATTYSTDYTDLWFIPAEAGWGLNLIQQNQTM